MLGKLDPPACLSVDVHFRPPADLKQYRTGDARDEIMLWDLDRIWIYTQEALPAGDRVYRPRRQPHYNMSDYRAEVSIPAWQEN